MQNSTELVRSKNETYSVRARWAFRGVIRGRELFFRCRRQEGGVIQGGGGYSREYDPLPKLSATDTLILYETKLVKSHTTWISTVPMHMTHCEEIRCYMLLFLSLLRSSVAPRVHKNKSMQRPISSLWGPGTAKFQVTWLLRIVQNGVSVW